MLLLNYPSSSHFSTQMLCWDILQAISLKPSSLNDSEGHEFAECCSDNEGELLHTNINRTLENLCCTGCRVSRLNGEVVYTLIALYYGNVAFVQNTGRLPIHMHTHIHSHTQVDSKAQQMLNTPTQIYPHFIDSNGYCVGGIVREQKRQCVRERE